MKQVVVRVMNSGSCLAVLGGQTGFDPLLIKGCVGFIMVGWEKIGPKKI